MTKALHSAGPWTNNVTVVPASFLNDFRTWGPDWLDGAGGGTWAPSAAIIVGGSGMKLDGSLNLALTSRNITRRQDLVVYEESANWSYQAAENAWNEDAVTTDTIYMHLTRLLNGGSIQSVTARFDGAGHGGSLPAVMPSIALIEIDEDGTRASKGSQVDTTGTAAAFDTPHDVVLTLTPFTIDLVNNIYVVDVVGESGANSQINLRLLSLKVTIACTSYSEF